MKLFIAVLERDGETIRERGRTSTEIIQDKHHIVADNIKQAFIYMDDRLYGRTLVQLYEAAPMVEILESRE